LPEMPKLPKIAEIERQNLTTDNTDEHGSGIDRLIVRDRKSKEQRKRRNGVNVEMTRILKKTKALLHPAG
jgi:hypothetical protein